MREHDARNLRFASRLAAVASALVVALGLGLVLRDDDPPAPREASRLDPKPASAPSAPPAPGPLDSVPRDAAEAPRPSSPPRASVTPPKSPSPPRADSLPSTVAREHLAAIPNVRRWADADGTGVPSKPFVLPLPDGRTLSIAPKRHEAWTAQGGVVYGELPGVPGSYAVLAYADDAAAGTVFAPGVGLFRIRAADDGLHRIAELRPERFPGCSGAVLPPRSAGARTSALGAAALAAASVVGAGPMETEDVGATEMPAVVGDAQREAAPVAPKGTTRAPRAAAAADAPVARDAVTIDVMLVWTPAMQTANGGASGALALATSSIANANLAHSHSGTGITLRLVASGQVAYTETGALGTDLGRLASTTDGYLDGVHATRDTNKADLVSLLVTGAADACGIGYLWTPGGAAYFGAYGFSVVLDSCADANLSYAHEVGHNLGGGHALGDGGSGAYAYSYGYKFSASGTAYRTVMAYAPGTRVAYFSSPGVTYLGAATGTTSADNVTTFLNSKASIMALRSGLTADQQLWRPVAAGDFNADGQTDIVWRHAGTGRVIVWFMSGTTHTTTTAIWSGDSAWVPVGAGDFNGDGQTDLVWRNTTSGRVIVWLMSGTTATSVATLFSGPATWIPVTVGDFNGDGKPDVVWRNVNDGRVQIWLMNGVTMASSAMIWTSGTAWTPMAAGDFNGDGKADLVWQNTSGRTIVWYMNGTASTGSAALYAGSGWTPLAAGNFAGDAGADVVWRGNADGRVQIWTMSAATMASNLFIWQ